MAKLEPSSGFDIELPLTMEFSTTTLPYLKLLDWCPSFIYVWLSYTSSTFPEKNGGHTTGSQSVGFYPKAHLLQDWTCHQHFTWLPGTQPSRQCSTRMPSFWPYLPLSRQSNPHQLAPSGTSSTMAGTTTRTIHDNIRGTSKARSASILANCWSRLSSFHFRYHVDVIHRSSSLSRCNHFRRHCPSYCPRHAPPFNNSLSSRAHDQERIIQQSTTGRDYLLVSNQIRTNNAL